MAVIFQTAPNLPESVACRTFQIPDTKEWLGIFNALYPLMINAYNWEQVSEGDLTIDESIEIVKLIWDEYWSTTGLCGETGAGCSLPGLDTPPFRIGVNGRFEWLNPTTGEWGEPEGEYAIPPTPEREETTPYNRRCAAAANATNVMKQVYEAITDEIALGGDALQVAAAMVAALVTAVGGWIAAPVYAIIQLGIALFAGMIELLQALGADVWTSDFDGKLRCALFDCATSVGDVVEFDLTCLRESLTVEPDLLDPDWFYDLQLFAQIMYLIDIIGADGINAAGATTAITSFDCDDCGGWCYEIFFDETDGGWGQINAGTSSLYGVYSAGNGWTTTDALDTIPSPDLYNRMFYVGKLLPFSAEFTHVEIDLNYTKGTFATNRRAQGSEIGINFVSTIWDVNSTPAVNGTPVTFVWNGSLVSDSIVVFARTSSVTGSPVYSGSAVLKRILVRGNGDNPFGDDNCD